VIFLGHVDADGKGGGLGQGTVLRGLGRARRSSPSAMASCQRSMKRWTLLRHQLRHQRLGLLRPVAAVDRGGPAASWPGARLRAGAPTAGRSAPVRPAAATWRRLQAAERALFAGGQPACTSATLRVLACGNQDLTLSCRLLEALQQAGRWAPGTQLAQAWSIARADLHLATLEACRPAARAARVQHWRSSSGSLKAQVQKAAVDGSGSPVPVRLGRAGPAPRYRCRQALPDWTLA